MILVVIVAVGLGSYLLRVGPLLLPARWRPSARIEDGIACAGAAAIASLITSDLGVGVSGAPTAATVTAVGIAGALSWRGWSLVKVVTIGVVVFALVDAVV